MSTATIRNTSRIADVIRRRLPWSRRISPEQKQDITEMMPPRQANADADLEDEDWDNTNRQARTWWQGMHQARRRGRLYFIKEVGKYLLIPVAVVGSGVALHRNMEQSVDDELLPETHWFRQLETKSWVRIINLTPRAENYLLLQQVSNKDLLHFSEDVDILWFIHKLFEEGDGDQALQWFNLIKSDVSFRSQNNTTLNEVAQNLNDKSLLTPYEFVYISKAGQHLYCLPFSMRI